MSRRGAALRERRSAADAPADPEHERESAFEFQETPAIGRRVIEVARELLGEGMTSAEVCSLFTHAASVLAEQDDGLEPGEWLDLCTELEGGTVPGLDEPELGPVCTAPGGEC